MSQPQQAEGGGCGTAIGWLVIAALIWGGWHLLTPASNPVEDCVKRMGGTNPDTMSYEAIANNQIYCLNKYGFPNSNP